MFELLWKVFSWLFDLFSAMPEESQEEIIDNIAEFFADLYARYYDAQG